MVLVNQSGVDGWRQQWQGQAQASQVSQVAQPQVAQPQEQAQPQEEPQRQEWPDADKAPEEGQPAGLLHVPDGQAATWPQQSTQIILRSNPAAVRWSVDQVNRLLLAAFRDKRPVPCMPEFNSRADPAIDLSWMMLGADARACNWDPQQHFSMAFPAPASA